MRASPVVFALIAIAALSGALSVPTRAEQPATVERKAGVGDLIYSRELKERIHPAGAALSGR